MSYVLAKLIGPLLLPSNLCLLIGIAGLVLLPTRFRVAAGRLLALCIILLLVFGTLPTRWALMVPLENRFPQWRPGAEPPTGIIVLGGFINPGLSRARGQISLSQAAERITYAVTLARRYPQSRIVFSGQVEAPYAGQLLENLGIPASRVTLEQESRDTSENAFFSKRLVDPKPGEHWLLVTSASHMPRAVGAFRKAGFPVEPVPVDYQTGNRPPLWYDPHSFLDGIELTDYAAHEWIGLAGYWLAGKTSALFPAPDGP